jgi:hypothetical protein
LALLEVLVNDLGVASTPEERQRMLGANAAAARFFRRELLRATNGWPAKYLKDAGIGQVLEAGSTWKVGYAPDTWSNLVDHLQAEGFSHATMVRAGLMTWTDDGDAADRYRDQLMFVARDHRLAPTGFVGLGQDGMARSLTPDTAVHRSGNVLVGIEEQMDLLRDGAMPVVVSAPADAILLSEMSRQLDGEWVGVPACGEVVSSAQARMLRKFSFGDTVAVLIDEERAQTLTTEYFFDLMQNYGTTRAVALQGTVRELASVDGGAEMLREVLITAPPVMKYRVGGRAAAEARPDPEPPDRGPGL